MNRYFLLLGFAALAVAALTVTPEVVAAHFDPDQLALWMIAAGAGVGQLRMVGASRESMEKRAELVQLNEALLKKIGAATSETEARALEKEWDKRDAEIVELTAEIEKHLEHERRVGKQQTMTADFAKPVRDSSAGRLHWSGDVEPAAADGFRDVKTGKIVRVYRNAERFADEMRRRDQGPRVLNIGHVAYRAITGRWPDDAELLEEVRAMQVGVDADGGYTVPDSIIAREVIDNARAQSRVMQAGARTFNMEAGTVDLARLESDPSFEWKAELSDFTPGDVTIGRVRLAAKTVGCLIPVSEELLQDSVNIAQILQMAIEGGLAAEIDRVGLHGSGVGAQPTGIYGTSGVNVYSGLNSNAPPNYDFVSQAVQLVRTDNHEPNAMIAHPRTYGQLDRLKDANDQPMMPPRSFNDLKHFSTTNVRANLENVGSPNDDSAAFVGKWDELLIGMRLGLSLHASRDGSDGTVNALRAYAVLLRAVMRLDVAVLRPAAFCVVKQIGA